MRAVVACVFSILLLVPFASHAGDAPVRQTPKANLTVLVDAEMMLPAATLARTYATRSGTPLTAVLRHSDEAEQQILQGLEAHVLITADHALVERLGAQGLIDVSATRTIARTQLALVSLHYLEKRETLAQRISFAAIIASTADMPVFINAPTTHDGARAAKLLNGYEFTAALKNRVHIQANREEVADAIRDENGLGFMLAADAVAQSDFAVLSVLPEELAAPVTYDAVVLASESMQPSRDVVAFLQSPAARDIFSHFGFQPPSL